MKHSRFSIFVLFFVSVGAQAMEPKLMGLLRFTDIPYKNDFLIESDCKPGNNPTHMDNRLASKCTNSLKEQTYNLRLNYIKDFMRYLVYGTKDGKYFLKDQTDVYKELYPLVQNRENKFRAFANSECEMSTYCGVSCGSGDIDSGQGCLFDKIQVRSAYLDTEILSGITVGSGIDLSTNNIYLITSNFEIELKSDCKSGLFLCESVEYMGKKKSSNESIKLKGKPYFGRRDGSHYPHQLGVYFSNGDYEYYVDFSGTIEVMNTRKNKSILKENGAWKRNP